MPPPGRNWLSSRQAGLDPPLFMNVPEHFQLVQHLNVDEDGEIWLHLTSIERSGLLHLSAGGDELGFHAVIAEFDLMAARITMAGGRAYFMVPGREATAIYSADLP